MSKSEMFAAEGILKKMNIAIVSQENELFFNAYHKLVINNPDIDFPDLWKNENGKILFTQVHLDRIRAVQWQNDPHKLVHYYYSDPDQKFDKTFLVLGPIKPKEPTSYSLEHLNHEYVVERKYWMIGDD